MQTDRQTHTLTHTHMQAHPKIDTHIRDCSDSRVPVSNLPSTPKKEVNPPPSSPRMLILEKSSLRPGCLSGIWHATDEAETQAPIQLLNRILFARILPSDWGRLPETSSAMSILRSAPVSSGFVSPGLVLKQETGPVQSLEGFPLESSLSRSSV